MSVEERYAADQAVKAERSDLQEYLRFLGAIGGASVDYIRQAIACGVHSGWSRHVHVGSGNPIAGAAQ